MIEETISTKSAQRFYNWLGAKHDWAEFYESGAKQYALAQLNLKPGMRVLNVGVGTGKEQSCLQCAIEPNGLAFGLDLSPVMAKLAHTRSGTFICRADARYLPFAQSSFDRLVSTYVLDLLPADELPALLSNFGYVLKPGGRMVLVSLTEGVNRASRTVVALWKAAYAISPVVCGGCRPLQLAAWVRQAGFSQVQQEIIVQLGVPSEVIVAIR